MSVVDGVIGVLGMLGLVVGLSLAVVLWLFRPHGHGARPSNDVPWVDRDGRLRR